GGVALVGAELVEVVVSGDGLERRLGLAAHHPAALLDGGQGRLVGAGGTGQGRQGGQGGSARHQLAPAQVEALGGDLPAGDGGSEISSRHAHVLPYGR